MHLRDDPLFRITIPSKTQAYLTAGRPFIMGVAGDAAELVTEAGAGIVVPPESPADLARAIERMSEMPLADLDRTGQSGRDYYERHLSARVGVAAFAQLLRDTIRPKSGRFSGA